MPNDQAGTRNIALVVDDSPETLALVIDALDQAGITALIARSGLDALDLLDRIEPDLILLDAVMPGLDGFETCRRIKRRPAQAVTPVVFMTGLSDSAHIVAGFQAGGVDYVTKPIAPDELIARIVVHLANARLIADARRAIDATGRAVVALAPDGTVAWASPRARALMGPWRPAEDAALRPWLALAATQSLSRVPGFAVADPALRLVMIGRSALGDVLVRVAPAQAAAPGHVLARALGVSEREGEVLAWLATGKSNRDIAVILGLSPRTVTKHLEQIFDKLGVENRTMAAAICLRQLEDQG